MKLDEVMEWRSFEAKDGTVFDLTFLNSKKLTYVHSLSGKPDVRYDFWVTYSHHCFTKDYDHLSEEERFALAYRAPRETRPFCHKRYSLAKEYLCQIVENLGTKEYVVRDAGHNQFITVKVLSDGGMDVWYKVPFKMYKEQKKYRLHVLSAYPDKKSHGGGKVGFFTIAKNLKGGMSLPSNSRK